MSSLIEARAAFLKHCIEKNYPGGIHSVTFQPKPSRINQDRLVVEEWFDIFDLPWLFLAVLDGHGGLETSEYTADHLPSRIHAALRKAVKTAKTETLDAQIISDLLCSQVEIFDTEIGKDVKRLCPKPREMDDAELQALIDGPQGHILRRANSGTTFTAALIDGQKKNLWVVGIGDSSAVLSKITGDGRRDGQRLLPLHNTSTPLEYARIVLGHPSNELNIMKDNRILGGLTVTRAIGDFPFKFRSTFSKRIFTKLPSAWRNRVHHGVTKYNFTPPYVISKSDVRHIDLTSLKDQSPTLILYTDGVNCTIDGYFLFRQENRCTHDPARVMGALLGDDLDYEFIRDVFEHEVELKWNGPDGNRAVELLGNILAGRDPVRMTQVLDPDLLSEEGERDLYVDDTTIIVSPLG